MQTVLNVVGMTCAHCEKAVTDAVMAIEGVTSVIVDLEAGFVTVDHDDIVEAEQIRDAIEEAGYDIG